MKNTKKILRNLWSINLHLGTDRDKNTTKISRWRSFPTLKGLYKQRQLIECQSGHEVNGSACSGARYKSQQFNSLVGRARRPAGWCTPVRRSTQASSCVRRPAAFRFLSIQNFYLNFYVRNYKASFYHLSVLNKITFINNIFPWRIFTILRVRRRSIFFPTHPVNRPGSSLYRRGNYVSSSRPPSLFR